MALLGAVILLAGVAIALNKPPAPASSRRSLDHDRQVDAVLRRACADCHSAETRWPWYAAVPPASWLVRRDVSRARAILDLSSGKPLAPGEKLEMAAALKADFMPPRSYLMLHPDAELNAKDRKLIRDWATRP